MKKPLRAERMRRREFLKGTLAAGAGLALPSALFNRAGAAGLNAANINVAIIGCGSRGSSFLVSQALAAADVTIVALCDADSDQIADVISAHGSLSGVIQTQDYRTLLQSPTVNGIDAFLIASPTHWHAKQTLEAIAAGLDVYCEKPVSHSMDESRRMADYAAYYDTILQIGVQRRTSTGVQSAKSYLAAHAGGGDTLGPVQWIHSWWFSARQTIGTQTPWTPSFANLNWDLYEGPANMPTIPWGNGAHDIADIQGPPATPWHWNWNFGNGDLSNLGTHVLDLGLYIAKGVVPALASAPTRMRSLGQRYNYNSPGGANADGGQTPNVQLTLLDFAGCPVFVENRGLSSPSYMGQSSGTRIQCQNGYIIAYESAKAYDNSDVQIPGTTWAYTNDNGEDHMANFFAAVRSRVKADLIAPVASVNPTNDCCLVGNASYRMGATSDPTTIGTQVNAFSTNAKARFDDIQSHLTGSPRSINLTTNPLILGPWLTWDEANAQVTAVDGSTNAGLLSTANNNLAGSYRSGFSLPSPTPVELSSFRIS